MSLRRSLIAAFLLALEGPKRPWWAIIVPLGLGLILFQFEPPEKLVGLGIVAVVAFWAVVRASRRRYTKHLTSKAAKRLCPRCSYDVTNLPGPICPECGTDVPEYVEGLRQTLAKERVRRSPRTRLLAFTGAILLCILAANVSKDPGVVVGATIAIMLAWAAWAYAEWPRARA